MTRLVTSNLLVNVLDRCKLAIQCTETINGSKHNIRCLHRLNGKGQDPGETLIWPSEWIDRTKSRPQRSRINEGGGGRASTVFLPQSSYFHREEIWRDHYPLDPASTTVVSITHCWCDTHNGSSWVRYGVQTVRSVNSDLSHVYTFTVPTTTELNEINHTVSSVDFK